MGVLPAWAFCHALIFGFVATLPPIRAGFVTLTVADFSPRGDGSSALALRSLAVAGLTLQSPSAIGRTGNPEILAATLL